jgi:hypothetical protein
MRLFCVCVILCSGSGLATSWSLDQGVLPSVKRSWNWEISPVLQSGSERREQKRIHRIANELHPSTANRQVRRTPPPPFFCGRCSPWWTLASFTIALHWTRSDDFRLQFLKSTVFKCSSVECSHLTVGLPTRRVPSARVLLLHSEQLAQPSQPPTFDHLHYSWSMTQFGLYLDLAMCSYPS